MKEDLINFELPTERSSIIKVIGVGGGGSNAINYMQRLGIKDVNFVVVNTDAQALSQSPVNVKIQIGASLTEGRGAGSKPEVGMQSAIESIAEIEEILRSNTRMIFITAGMGGGTGTGAAPVIAKAARELGILTVAIVTIPFKFEGQQRINQAIDGLNELKEYVDSLLVINNEKLREIYGDLGLSIAFSKADNVLATAAKGIAEIITVAGYVNVDFADVQTVMANSGVAIMGSAVASGENRALTAIQEAVSSPLLNNNDITGAKNVLLNITSGSNEVTMDEVGIITDYVTNSVAKNTNIIWGTCYDPSLDEKISVTIIATGFETNSIPELYQRKKPTSKITLTELTSNAKPTNTPFEIKDKAGREFKTDEMMTVKKSEGSRIRMNDKEKQFELFHKGEDHGKRKINIDPRRAAERVKQIKSSQEKIKESLNSGGNENIENLENEPAFVRKKILIEDTKHSSEANVSKYTLSEDPENQSRISPDNPYLHDNVD
jgi:cell division protein FtsZ